MLTILTFITVLVYETLSESRYFIGDDSEVSAADGFGVLAFPVDRCFQTHGLQAAEEWVNYRCIDDGSGGYNVEKSKYSSEDDCTNDQNVLTNYPQIYSNPDTGTGGTKCGLYSYNCNPSDNDNFAELGLYIVDCSEIPNLALPVVTRNCFCTDDPSSFRVSCDDSTTLTGELQTFSDQSCGASSTITDFESCYEPVAFVKTQIYSCTEVVTPSPIDPGSPTSAPTDPTDSPTTEPTGDTDAPTYLPTSEPTLATPSPTEDDKIYSTRFILSSDWILKELYPWPIDKCVQTSPQFSFGSSFSFDPEFVYYECNDDGTEITKYYYDATKVEATESGQAQDFECPLDDYTSKTVLTKETDDICVENYFVCDGDDNYITASFELSLSTNWKCSGNIELFTTSIAAETCFCSDGMSGKVSCDADAAIAYNYTGQSCEISDANPKETVLGYADTCSIFATYNVNGNDLPILGTMNECVVNGNKATPKPTYEPTKEPTPETDEPTESPTASPTDEESDNAFGLKNTLNIIILTVFIVLTF